MKIKLNATNADELRALAIFIRNLADTYDRQPAPVGPIDVAADPPAHPLASAVEAEPELEPKPEPVEKKRRGRPPKAADAAAHVAAVVAKHSADADYTVIAKRAADYTEKRVNQADPDLILGKAEDSPEVQAADAADEAAESAVVKTQDPQLTHDDVRTELGAYMRKYGMPAAQEDGPRLFRIIFPDATPAKISDIPNTQEDLRKVLAGIREMSAKNPYQRAPVSA